MRRRRSDVEEELSEEEGEGSTGTRRSALLVSTKKSKRRNKNNKENKEIKKGARIEFALFAGKTIRNFCPFSCRVKFCRALLGVGGEQPDHRADRTDGQHSAAHRTLLLVYERKIRNEKCFNFGNCGVICSGSRATTAPTPSPMSLPLREGLAAFLDRLDDCYERLTSENCRFYLMVLVFFSMVLVRIFFVIQYL